jgi:mRNA-degrading endonuclease YafQ of YafQ-DinJ toxin-antitoxin module
MMEIQYAAHFLRCARKLPPEIQGKLIEKEKLFRQNCFDPRLKLHKLHGKLQDYWSFSVDYSYRVLLSLKKDSALFIEVGNHSIY